MADPISALGIIGAIGSLLNVTARTVGGLRTLQRSYSGATATLRQIVDNCSTLEFANHVVIVLLRPRSPVTSLGESALAQPQRHSNPKGPLPSAPVRNAEGVGAQARQHVYSSARCGSLVRSERPPARTAG